MTPLVLPGKPGKRVFVSQIRYDPPPRTQCRMVAACMLGINGGLRIPDPQRWIEAVRKATTVPEVDPATGESKGTFATDLIRAFAILFPWVPITYEPWNNDALHEALVRREVMASVTVRYAELPKALRRWSPSFTGGHVCNLAGARMRQKREQRLWVDPLGTGGYRGEWVDWEPIRDAMGDSAADPNRIWVTSLASGGAMSTLATVDRVFIVPATVTIPKGTDTWVLDDKMLNLRPAKPTAEKHEARASSTLRVLQAPVRPPRGRFVHISTGTLAGRYVRASDVTIMEDPAPADCQLLIDQATAPLVLEISERDTALAAIRTVVESVTP